MKGLKELDLGFWRWSAVEQGLQGHLFKVALVQMPQRQG